MGCDIVELSLDTSVSEECAVFIFDDGVNGEECQSKPVGMVKRKYGKNEDTCGSE